MGIQKPRSIGDGSCDDRGDHNAAECGWDGGDCEIYNSLPNWRVDAAWRIGDDGNCDGFPVHPATRVFLTCLPTMLPSPPLAPLASMWLNSFASLSAEWPPGDGAMETFLATFCTSGVLGHPQWSARAVNMRSSYVAGSTRWCFAQDALCFRKVRPGTVLCCLFVFPLLPPLF